MARSPSADTSRHAWGDLIGWLGLSIALILTLALVSYDRHDLAANAVPANSSVRNWMGPFGAYLAYELFLVCGAAAYALPVVALFVGLAGFTDTLAHLRRWRGVFGTVGMLVGLCGLLDLYSQQLPALGVRGDSMGAGGILGWALNDYVFRNFFNRIGATVIYGLTYLVSWFLLTDFHLLLWVRQWLEPDPSRAKDRLEAAELSLKKEARELARKQKELQRGAGPVSTAKTSTRSPEPQSELLPSGLGSDGKPVPEPRVRDLSVPQLRDDQLMKDGDVIRREDLVGKMGEKVPTSAFGTERKRPGFLAKILGRDSQTPAAADAPLNSAIVKDTDDPDYGVSAETKAYLAKTGRGPDVASADPNGELDAEQAAALNEEASPFTPEALAAAVHAPTAKSAPPNPGWVPSPPRVVSTQRRTKPITVASTPMIGNYQLPSIALLQTPDLTIRPTETKEELMANARLMVQTLAQFGIEVAPGDITKGPTITRYELHPAPGVKLEKIAALTNNIAAALKAERLNVLAPVPGKSSVGIEVPNLIKTKVIMRDLLETPEWVNSKARIPLALGKDVYGQPIIADLADMPHVMIAGSTGSGKSVCINTIIASLLYKFTPDQLRFVMIDPKVVELQQYNPLPHLVVPVVTDPKKVILALRWVVNEMEKRYQIFARVGVRNIKSFNERPREKDAEKAAGPKELELPLMQRKEKVEPGADGFAVEIDEQIVVPREEDIIIPEKLSYIVVIIDELADLMLVAPADVEMAIARITQMARAAGIHCIVATQRPSVDVITGVIKANIPARIAFQVAAKVDSRTILDQMGADKLLGKGDMLYLPPGSGRLIRAQGALITDQEIERVVEHIARQGKPSYEVDIHQALQKAPSSMGSMPLDPDDEGSGEDEEIVQKCITVIRTEKKASVSLLQRRLKLGYGRAARMMDELEDRGVVGPSKGAEPRDILIDLDGTGYDGSGQTMV